MTGDQCCSVRLPVASAERVQADLPAKARRACSDSKVSKEGAAQARAQLTQSTVLRA